MSESVFIEGVTNGRELVYRAYHRPTGTSVEIRYPPSPDPAGFFDIICDDLRIRLGQKVRDCLIVTEAK